MEKAKITFAPPYSGRPLHCAFVLCNMCKHCAEVKWNYPGWIIHQTERTVSIVCSLCWL